MSRMAKLAALVLLLAGASSALGACQAIAGIEERTYQPVTAGAAGADPNQPPSQECVDYCEKAKTTCHTALDGTDVPGGVLYLTDEACLATCQQLLNADPKSISCRVQQLRSVSTGEDPDRYCANAGPGGNGVCGSNCQNYCQLFKGVCREQFEKYAPTSEGDDGIATCVSKCAGLTDTGYFDTTKSATGNYFGDTLQCRLVHTCSSIVDSTLSIANSPHCQHAEFKAAEKCLDDPMAKPDCEKFCHFERVECPNNLIYESQEQCEAVCGALPSGHIGDTVENTVGCRMYHTYNSMIDPAGHCSHTGPGGDGHCGDHDGGNCESYCMLLDKACKAGFDAKFADQAACQADCAKLDGSGYESGYSTAAKGNNLQCRLLHVSRALTESAECGAAQGAAPCK
jgi:hypothetical protein